jgi:hypothetical protein
VTAARGRGFHHADIVSDEVAPAKSRATTDLRSVSKADNSIVQVEPKVLHCAYEECSVLDLLTLTATVVGVVLGMTLLRPTPTQALRQFHTREDIAEDQIACPLVLAGPAACPLALREVRSRKGVNWRYAFLALASLRCRDAVPYLDKMMRDETEKEFLRVDALETLWLIEDPPPEAYARSLAARRGTLGMFAKWLVEGEPAPEMSPWDAVWCWHN